MFKMSDRVEKTFSAFETFNRSQWAVIVRGALGFHDCFDSKEYSAFENQLAAKIYLPRVGENDELIPAPYAESTGKKIISQCKTIARAMGTKKISGLDLNPVGDDGVTLTFVQLAERITPAIQEFYLNSTNNIKKDFSPAKAEQAKAAKVEKEHAAQTDAETTTKEAALPVQDRAVTVDLVCTFIAGLESAEDMEKVQAAIDARLVELTTMQDEKKAA